MRILFIDESGTPPKPGQHEPRYFVIGGIVVPEASWHTLRDGLLGIKLRRKIRGEFKWRYFAPGNDDERNPMRGLPQAERDAIRAEIYRIVTAERSVRTMAAICSNKAAYAMDSVTSQEDIYHLTFKTVTERFQYFLQDFAKEVGRVEYGIVVSDQRGSDSDRRLRYHHERLIYSSGAVVSRYHRLVESLFIQPSNLSIGIQLADMVAGAVWRCFERDDPRWYDLIEPSLRRSPKGDVAGYGIIKVPKQGWE